MPEVVIKYKSESALKALYDLSKAFEFSIEKKTENTDPTVAPDKTLPVIFSTHPNVTALAGIWEGRDVDLESLRKDAWGDRI